MANGELKQRAIYEAATHGSIRAAARANGITHGMIASAIKGGNSPTLRRIWKIPKHEPRHRLIISCSQETIARFDAQRGERTRQEWLDVLIDIGDGIGDVV